LQFDSRKTNLSYRSFRKIFLENFKFSFQRLLTLFEIIYDFSLCSKIYIKNEKSVQLKNQKIIKIKFISFLFFLNIPKEKVDFSIFEKASLKKICQTETECYFSIPTFRNDLNREIDLIEEYCRFLGYQEIQEILPKKYIFSGENKKENKKWIKEFFFNHSFFEVLTNSLDEKENKNSLFLKNPLNKEFTLLRTSLLPKILEIFEFNLRTNLERKNYFEIGRVFLKENKKIIEIEKIAGLFQLERNKKTKGPNTEWFLAKGFIEKFCLSFGYQDITFELVSSKDLYLFPFSHEKNTIFLKYGTIYLGIFGQLNSFTKSFEQKYPSKYSTYFFELNLMAFPFSQLKSKIKPFIPFSKYPTISKDFSFLIQKNIEFSKIKKEIWQICVFLKKVEFFDIYFDQLSIEKVNIGIRLVFQSNKETLTIEMIEKELIKVKTILIQKFQVEFKE
jgi:phenylalanyl-tRNA synthetase beta chain